MSVNVKPSELMTILRAMIPQRQNVLITGAPGVGKTEMQYQVDAELGRETVVSHPVLSDPTDAKGMPWVWLEDGRPLADFVPFAEVYQILNAVRPTTWFIDDIGQAAPATQASFMRPMKDFKIAGRAIPRCVSIVAATNRREDRAGVSGMLEPVKSRFVTIVNLEVNLDEFKSYAWANGVSEGVIGFLSFRPDLLHQFKANADLTNTPSPRTWKHASDLIGLGLPAHCEYAALAGAVGEGAASELKTYLKMWRELPDLDVVIKDPEKAPIPKEQSTLYATCVGLAGRATDKTCAAVLRYAERLHEKNKDEFATLLVRDTLRKDQKLTKHSAFQKLAETKWGDVVLGIGG